MEEPTAPIPPPPKPANKATISIVKLAGALVVALACGGILVAVQAAREEARKAYCCNNFMQIGLALLAYESANGAFPPAVSTDKGGKPMMSWRVAILPYLNEQALYQRYDPKQPWNSPRNRALGNTAVPYFRCPSDPGTIESPTETNYVRIVGKDTVAGAPNEQVTLSDITDGTSNTIMLVEISGLNINWEEPRDVTVEEFMGMVAKGRASNHPGGFQAAMADGSVHFISYGIAPKTLRALLLRNDGQPIGDY